VAIASFAWAQGPAPAAPRETAKPQVQTFEMVLKTAVETGGRMFANRASEMAPEISVLSFAPGESPTVSGIADHQLGLYVFQVQVPGVSLFFQVANMMLRRPNGLQAIGGRANTDPASPFDLEREYREQVREALLAAVLDNSGGLPLTGSDTLLIYAGGIDSPAPNPLQRGPSNKLVIKAKGADLTDLRQGRLSRDEAKRRIQVTSF
jgi:hypothetical protein